MEEKFCPCCGNHCPVDDLKCGRGRRYFKGELKDEGERPEKDKHDHHKKHGDEEEDRAISLLRRCGHTLHHGGDGEKMLSNLSEEEKNALCALLEKLID